MPKDGMCEKPSCRGGSDWPERHPCRLGNPSFEKSVERVVAKQQQVKTKKSVRNRTTVEEQSCDGTVALSRPQPVPKAECEVTMARKREMARRRNNGPFQNGHRVANKAAKEGALKERDAEGGKNRLQKQFPAAYKNAQAHEAASRALREVQPVPVVPRRPKNSRR